LFPGVRSEIPFRTTDREVSARPAGQPFLLTSAWEEAVEWVGVAEPFSLRLATDDLPLTG